MSAEPKDLTAWERWELASFDAPPQAAPAGPARVPNGLPDGPPIVLPTASEIEQIHQQAQDEGRRAGYAEGRELARQEAERLAGLLKQLEGALTEFDQQVGEELLALAVEIARRVVGQAITVDPEAVLETVRGALAELPHQHAAVHLHPEDAALVRSYLGEQLTHAGHRIYEDPALARGGCLVEAGGSQVDATLATRWRRVLEGLGTPPEWVEANEK
jgi:flagellar assembly protein FliH